MSRVDLRDYQVASVEGLRAGIRAGHRKQVLVAPTGAGKTEIACSMLEEANAKQSRALFIVDRVVLVDQTSERLDRYEIPHGVLQGDHWRHRPYERLQVCSAQTLEKRGIPEGVDLIMVDEAHAMRQKITELLANTSATVVGLTATPFTKGMGKVYSNLVNVTTTDELIRRDFLVPLKTYAAKAVNMKGAKTIGGEYAASEASKRGMAIVGDIVSEWRDKTTLHFGGPVKTIVFSADVKHGEELCRHFQAAGFNFQQISYQDGGDNHRRALIEEFRKPNSEIHGLVSCEVFTKGFDVPDVLCGISARAYKKSLASHIQQRGRVMRKAEGKEFGLWLDHSGNVLLFREDELRIYAEGVTELDEGRLESQVRREITKKEREEIRCSCGYLCMPWDKKCPGCGKERKRRSGVEVLPGVMHEVTGGAASKLPDWMQNRGSVWNQLCTYAERKYSGNAEQAKKFALAKYKAFYGSWPGREYAPTEQVSVDLQKRLKHEAIKFAKGAARKAA